MPPAAVTLYCVLLFTFSHLHRFWLFCPCVLQFLSSLFFYLPLSHHCFPFHPPPPPASLQQLLSPLSFFHFAGKIKMISEHKTYTSCTTAWGNPPAVALHFSARPLVVGLPSRGEDNDFFYHACPCTRLFACDKDDVWYVCDETCFSSSPSLTCPPQSLLC